MSEQWTVRELDKGNCLIVAADGTWVCLCDARYVDLLMAAPDLVVACERLLRFNKELCEDSGISTHYESAEFARKTIEKATSGARGAPGVGGQ